MVLLEGTLNNMSTVFNAPDILPLAGCHISSQENSVRTAFLCRRKANVGKPGGARAGVLKPECSLDTLGTMSFGQVRIQRKSCCSSLPP